MDKLQIEHMTSEELLKIVFHKLNQKSASALTLVIALTSEDVTPSGNMQKEIILTLKQEVETIRQVADMIKAWLLANAGPTDNSV